VSYAAMVLAGLVIGFVFNIAGAVPTNRNIIVFDTNISWNYDTFLNIAFLLFIAGLSARFLRTGGMAMLRQMEIPPAQQTAPRDPVCGMAVNSKRTDQTVVYDGTKYLFCSAGCRATFEADPAAYAHAASTDAGQAVANSTDGG
jgi:YHS domain-containing protein